MTDFDAGELIEELFSFEHVGDSMFAVRKNLDDIDAQKVLTDALVTVALEQAKDDTPETVAVLTKAAAARVSQYVETAKKAKGTGCG